jgi:hypothetical protein
VDCLGSRYPLGPRTEPGDAGEAVHGFTEVEGWLGPEPSSKNWHTWAGDTARGGWRGSHPTT